MSAWRFYEAIILSKVLTALPDPSWIGREGKNEVEGKGRRKEEKEKEKNEVEDWPAVAKPCYATARHEQCIGPWTPCDALPPETLVGSHSLVPHMHNPPSPNHTLNFDTPP